MDAILLAAGNSSRFGTNKLLYELDGKRMYRYVLEKLYRQKRMGNLNRIVVVSQYEEIFADIRENFPEIETVLNPQPERGIASSLKLGLEVLQKEVSQACLFAVADQPCLTETSLEKMIRMWERKPGGIVAAACGEKTGNPVIFSEKYYGELMELNGDVGGKCVVRRHPGEVALCEMPTEELRDFDTLKEISCY